MSGHGRMSDTTTLRFERRLPGPPERIFEYVTNPEKRARWLAGGPMEPRVGGAVELRFDHGQITDSPEPTPERWSDVDGVTIIRGRVTRCEPPRVIAWTWETGSERSEVTIELESEGDGTRLVLTHRRIDDPSMRVSVLAGWHAHLDILGDELAGVSRRPFWSRHLRLEDDYRELLHGQ